MRWVFPDPNDKEENAARTAVVSRIERWWQSFAEHADEIRDSFHDDSEFDIPAFMRASIEQIDQRLGWEFGPALNGDGDRLVITPEHNLGLRPLADAIIAPVTFFGVAFSITTSDTDPETGDAVTEVTITAEDGTLSGQTTAVTAAYGGQQFNQGAPKPDGSLPGETTEVSGTYDAETGAYTLDWSSQIVGGSFDGFTGVWHLEGTFTAA